MQNKVNSCPICSREIVPEFVKQHNQYKIYRCPECDVVYSEPFTNPGQEYYGNTVFSWSHFTEIPMRWQFKVFLSQGGHADKRLLDIGCDNGSFLYYARNRGYRVVGIDLNSAAIKEGRELFALGDDELLCTSLEAYADSGETFDVITLFETLEHLDNPNEVMENIKKLLKPNGLLALTVPNPNRFLDTIGEWDYPPFHLSRWSLRALKKFVESHGFEIGAHKIKPVNGWEVAYFTETWLAGNIKQVLREKAFEGIKQDRKSNKPHSLPLLWKLSIIQLNILSFVLHLPAVFFFSLIGKEGNQQYLLAKSRVQT